MQGEPWENKVCSNTRREFLGNVGRGMLLAGLGTTLSTELGLATAEAADAPQALTFGELEPLVALMQDTEPVKLTAILVEKLKSGTSLKTMVAAGALANARTFGGQDYVGFHTFMALAPAYTMSQQLPLELQPLPVLKVLYRNADRIQEFGGRANETLRSIVAEPIPDGAAPGEYLRDLSRTGDIEKADRTFASLSNAPVGEAFNHLQFAVEDEVDVHRVVLAWRAWDTLDLAGQEWANCLLRQSIRYCASREKDILDRGGTRSSIRTVLPALLDQYDLLETPLGDKSGDDTWLNELATTMFRGTRDEAAAAVAQSLRAGYSPECIGEAMSLAANMLVLHDPGRPDKWANADKPVGSCHGDSIGVHASDAANAWRNIARVSNPRNTVASLIVGGYHTAGASQYSNAQPYPLPEHLAEVTTTDAAGLLREAEEAIRAKDQFRAAATMARYGELGHDARPAFDLMLKFATSEDGALHAEKYYRTATAEFDAMRSSVRWGQVTALARVTASEYGHLSPGYQAAKQVLGT
ncbi:MAG: hypothetical protein HUU46_20725 [Candidatus Hydrogenedentes bacterium]|nr:hypothetical protein [Candidatus Hydrogenedentota bacterium]